MRLPRVRFTVRRMMAAVAVVAVILTGVVNPSVLTASLGVLGALTVFVFGLRSEEYSIVPISIGFLAGGLVGWVVFEGTYSGPWEGRRSAAIAVELALPTTLLVLWLYLRCAAHVRSLK